MKITHEGTPPENEFPTKWACSYCRSMWTLDSSDANKVRTVPNPHPMEADYFEMDCPVCGRKVTK